MEITRTEILEYALAGFERQRQEILAQIAEVNLQLGRGAVAEEAERRPIRRRHRISAEGRRRISAAAKRRWARERRRRRVASHR